MRTLSSKNTWSAPFLLLALIATAYAFPALQAQEETTPETSILRVNATLQSYNFIRPWEKGAPTPRRGLGAVLTNNRVLVTAEMCVNATYLELEHPATGARVPAKIVGRDYEANLAVLEPLSDGAKVFDGLKPLEIDTSIVAGDKLEVWQVEDNGDSVTTSVEVLRADVGRYFIEDSMFLLYQVKGSLQARANSFTLPVVKDGKLVGMLLSYSSNEQTATILPAPVIQAFLDDLEDGDYAGFPNLGIAFEQTLDTNLRQFLGLSDRMGGIYVRRVAKDSSAGDAGLEVGDVVVAINGHALDSRGNFEHPMYGKLSFAHLVRSDAKVGDTVKFDIIRDAQPQSIDVELKRKLPTQYMIDPYMYDRGPNYLIFGGLIFQELTVPYLQSWGDDWENRAPFKLVHAAARPEAYEEEGREKLVFLSNVLKTPSTLGYETISSVVVSQINGKMIKNLSELSAALAAVPEDGIHTIEFNDYPKVIYVDDRASRVVNDQLLQYGIARLERIE